MNLKLLEFNGDADPLPSSSFEVEAREKAEDEAIAELLSRLSPIRPASQSELSSN